MIVEDLSPSTEVLLGVRRCEGDAGSVSFAPSERVRGHSMRCCIYLSGKGMDRLRRQTAGDLIENVGDQNAGAPEGRLAVADAPIADDVTADELALPRHAGLRLDVPPSS